MPRQRFSSALVVALAGATVVAVAATTPARSQTLSERQRQRVTPIVEVVQKVRPAVVNISATHVVTERQSVFDFFEWGAQPRRSVGTSVGSGSVIHPLGYVLTNAHVVDQASELSVTNADGDTRPARVVAVLPEEDIALVKVVLDAGERWPAVTLGRSDDAMVGETVVAIGNPVGLGHTVTTGIVSATARSIEPRRGVRMTGLLQTDAAINPGNSGGPLLNVLGEQIGVNTAIRGDAQNVGFAIGINRVRALLPTLLDVERHVDARGGRYRLGARLGYAETDDATAHLRVLAVQPSSPAAEARLDAGVELVGVNDVDLRFPGDTIGLLVALNEAVVAAGGAAAVPVVLRVLHPEGSIEQVRLTLRYRAPPDGGMLARRRLGASVQDIDATAAMRLGLRGGVIVTEVDKGGPAARAGLQPGDLLLRLGTLGIARVSDLVALDEVPSGAKVPIRVVRIDRQRIRSADVTIPLED